MIFGHDIGITNQHDDIFIVDQHVTVRLKAHNRLVQAFFDDFLCEILAPTTSAEFVSAVQIVHVLEFNKKRQQLQF